MSFIAREGPAFRLDGRRFRFVGMNYYSAVVETKSQETIRELFAAAQRKGVTVFRTWCFDAGDPPTNSPGNFRYLSGSQLLHREPTYQHLDMVLNEAREHGIKLILSLADNPSYDTKKTYVGWANAIFGSGLSTSSPYVGFFDAPECRQIYKDNIAFLINRTNTINGKLYRDDDTIFSWELGNEMRYDVFDSEGGTQNTLNSQNIAKVRDWIEDVGGYIQSADPNHLVGFSSVSHTWQWVNGDSVSNGSGYGVDYNLFGDIDVLDYLSFHVYPNQAGTQLKKYGQRLGAPNAVTRGGFEAQIRDFVSAIHSNNKPALWGEVGFAKETVGDTSVYPLYPRHNAFREIFRTFFDAGGDGLLLWSATMNPDATSYSVVLDGVSDSIANLNSDDRPLMSLVAQRNCSFAGGRTPIHLIDRLAP